jgi:predicted TPR repeat methyltransferase
MKQSANPGAKQRLRGLFQVADDDENRAYYNHWAGEYDADLSALSYPAPPQTATMLAGLVSWRDRPVLDAGCGTGLSGEALRSEGFAVIDGLDYAQGMLEQAQAKGLYRNLDLADLGQPQELAAAPYAAIVTVGTLTYEFLGVELVEHLMPALEVGGCFVLCTNATAWGLRSVEDYLGTLVQQGRITGLVMRACEYLPAEHASGMVAAWRKC